MLLFIASEIMLFGSFFTIYFFVRVVNNAPEWPPERVPPAGLRRRREHGDPRHLELHDALGAAGDQARQPRRAPGRARADARARARRSCSRRRREYSRIGSRRSDNAFGTVFYALTRPARRPRPRRPDAANDGDSPRLPRATTRRRHHHGVEIPGIYWHFVDVMWVVVYTTIYILKTVESPAPP